MPWPALLLDAVLAALVLAGAGFALIGSWGLARLSDFFKRLHAPSKATTLGAGCVLLASALWFGARGSFVWQEIAILVFLFLTAPVAAHLLARAALSDRTH